MIDILSSFVSTLGSIFSGIAQLAAWILALQGLFLGLMVLFYGRRSFWVLASVVGFVLGLWLASGFSTGLPAWAQPVLALALGIAGAAVGFFVPRPVAAIIGSLALALLGVALAHSSGAALWLQWLIAIALGFVGFYLFWRLLDWALMVGTSLFGALLASLSLSSLFSFARDVGVLPFLLFLVAGIVYQARDRQTAAELKRMRSKLSPASAEVTPPAPLAQVAQPAMLPLSDVDADRTAITPGETVDPLTGSETPVLATTAVVPFVDTPAPAPAILTSASDVATGAISDSGSAAGSADTTVPTADANS